MMCGFQPPKSLRAFKVAAVSAPELVSLILTGRISTSGSGPDQGVTSREIPLPDGFLTDGIGLLLSFSSIQMGKNLYGGLDLVVAR